MAGSNDAMSTTDIPRLSVVLPVYNGARFLASALDSVLSQDFREFECIAINDGSTDQSPLILEEYQRRDSRLRVVHQHNVGVVETLNRGISLSRAPFIARMDADDVCLPGRFTTQMRHFKERNDLGVLGGQIQLIDEKGHLLRTVDYPASGKELESFLFKGSPVAHPAVMLRKAVMQKVGLYRKAFKHAEDYDLWLRVHEAGYAIENLKVPLIGYRQHTENVSVVYRREQALATLAAQCAYRARLAGLPDPTTNLEKLDERVFDLFPASLIADLKEELFSVLIGTNSFETRDQLTKALVAFRRLPSDLRRSRRGGGFLIQAARGAWRCHSYSLAAASVIRAFAAAPMEVVSVAGRKLIRVFRRSLSEAIHRSTGKVSSNKSSID
jgi:glycosyltransferase involved in cell wall biosynthesis